MRTKSSDKLPASYLRNGRCGACLIFKFVVPGFHETPYLMRQKRIKVGAIRLRVGHMSLMCWHMYEMKSKFITVKYEWKKLHSETDFKIQ